MDTETAKFIEGLKQYNLSKEQIENGDWVYAGGDNKQHLKYFTLLFPKKKLPFKSLECVCGHYIEHNCYIRNKITKEFLILGSCCIKKFIPNKFARYCEVCNKQHKNTKDNKCNECRNIKRCLDCKIVLRVAYHRYCLDCYYERN
jgi:hypothetical protein